MKFVFIFFYYFTFLHCHANQHSIDSPAVFITKFPFTQLSGGVIMIHAKFNNIKRELNFILDTGSGAISLDSSTAANDSVFQVPSGKSITNIAGTKKVNFVQNCTLSIPGLQVDSLDFYINDYEILSEVYGIKIDGIIGYSFLSKFIVKINFDEHEIQIFSPGKIKYPKRGTLLHPIFTALPIQSLIISDRVKSIAKFYMDTGAGLNFLVSEQFVKDSSFLKKKRKPVSIQVQGPGGKKRMLLTVIQELKIGPYKFKRVPTNILQDESNVLSYPHIGGLIGNDLLRRFNMVLNYPEKEIHLSPNSHFKDAFDYSYTGINMYYKDGLIFSDDVIENSPAYKAGLREGDVILGVNNNFTNDIEAYKIQMNEVGKYVTLFISRNGELQNIIFQVDEIG